MVHVELADARRDGADLSNIADLMSGDEAAALPAVPARGAPATPPYVDWRRSLSMSTCTDEPRTRVDSEAGRTGQRSDRSEVGEGFADGQAGGVGGRGFGCEDGAEDDDGQPDADGGNGDAVGQRCGEE